MTWHDVTAVTRWHRFAMRRRSWEDGVAYRHCKWQEQYTDPTSPKYRCAPQSSIHFATTMSVHERRIAAGKNNDDNRVDYAIADANDWVLADYHTMVEVEHLPYRAALTLAHRGLTVRRSSWPAHWHMIRLRQRGDLDDGAAICNGISGQISMMSQLDRDAIDWMVIE